MRRGRSSFVLWSAPALALLLLLVVPFIVLSISVTPSELVRGAKHPLFLPALRLSLETTLVSLTALIVSGTPFAWWLGTSRSRWVGPAELLLQLPIVIPPAVVGVALLATFGRGGLVGPALSELGLSIPFSRSAVVTAQIVVAAPFYLQAAGSSFRSLDPDVLLVSRTLGASRVKTFFHVALPLALPGLIVGASLSFARALGEFGATLLFAGNLPGVTQTMPLSILTALESDLNLGIVFSFMLGGLGVLVLFVLRAASALGDRAERPGRGASS